MTALATYLILLFLSGIAVQLAPVSVLAFVMPLWGAALYFGISYWMMWIAEWGCSVPICANCRKFY